MPLSDIRYLGFLLAVAFLFYLLPTGKPRRVLLLAASYYFYASLSGIYISVLLAVTALTYFGGLSLRAPTARLPMLFTLLLCLVLTPLILFKYAYFLSGLAAGAISVIHPVTTPLHPMLIPIGISFFTFAAIGYLIDVYLEVIEPEDRPLYVALFLAFFPLVSAGPIERGNFIPQFDLDARFTASRGLAACRLIFWGLFLKLVLADTLSEPVNAFFADPDNTSALEKLCGIFHYTFSLYADFAGYSLIAIGSAMLLGLSVRPNFQQPFLSASVPEFWRNWHMSLSTWLRDYLFTPLRMHWRRHTWGTSAALMVSFTTIGIWHGAALAFLAFGVMHGVMVVVSTLTLERRNAFWASLGVPPMPLRLVRIVITFALVMLTFVVFRAASLHDAGLIYKALFSTGWIREAYQTAYGLLHGTPPALKFFASWTGWAIIGAIIIGDICVRNRRPLECFPLFVQVIGYNTGVILILYKYLAGNVAAPFMYYQF